MSTQLVNRVYSQNRLRRRLLRRLLARSSIDKGDLVYDIGAGDGVITLELVNRGARVVAIEKDRRLYLRLNRKIGNNILVTLRHEDFLAEELPKQVCYKVFANLPFVGTSSITRKLLFDSNPPVDSYLIMQKEAAEKLAGIHREYMISLLLKPRFRFTVIHTFQAQDFFPVSGVEILMLRVEKRKQPLVSPKQAILYRRFVTHCMRCGKPTIKRALKDILSYTHFMKLAHDLHFTDKENPSELTFPQWLGLFDFFVDHRATDEKWCGRSATRLPDSHRYANMRTRGKAWNNSRK
jgi:23S rRNA (adenine-N6)-dimethyltransferase